MNTTKYILTAVILFFFGFLSAQSSDDILNLLVKNGAIKQTEADSLRADFTVKQQKKENQKLFSVNSGRGIQISGYSQVRFQSLQESGKPDGFDIRRARLDVKGTISPVWEYRFQSDFASVPKLLDAYAVYKPFTFLKITAGQFYIPFSLENVSTPDNQLETIDRSQAVTALVAREKDVIGNQNGRDIGIQLSGSLFRNKERFLADYYAGYFNGSGINVLDYNESKDVVGRLVLHPFKFIDIGGSYYNGYDSWGTPAKNQNRIRVGGELSFNYKGLSVKGEYIQGTDGKTIINSQLQNLNRAGWYAQASYFIFPKHLQAVFKYDSYDPNTFKAPENAPQNDVTTYFVFGLNYYFNDWAKLQVNYIDKIETGQQINNDIIVAQFQISF